MNAQSAIQPSLVGALAKALAEIEGVQKNKDNPGLRGARYADMSAVIDAIEPVKAFGLWYRQASKRDPEGALIETFYIHESGEELSAGETFVPANKRDPQGFGSALTYCRRYALMTAFGLAAEDDDGHAATQSVRNQRRDEPAPARQQARQQQAAPAATKQDKPAGGMPEEAFAKITQLLNATSTAPAILCEHYKVENIGLLSKAQFDDAVERLEADLAKLARKQTNQRANRNDFAGADMAGVNL